MSMLDVVRKACLPAVWSQGAKLAREGSVQGTATAGEFRVRAPGFALALTVTLYPDDEEWSCDCAGKVDPCAHVAAAAIADAQGTATSADAGSAAGVSAPAAGRVAYRLSVKERRLTVSRFLVDRGGTANKLVGSLSTMVARGKLPPGLEPTHDDLRLDRVFGETTREDVPLVHLKNVLEALAAASDVSFEGAPVRTSGETVAPRATVVDDGAGFVVRIERDPAIEAVVAMGVVRVAGVFRPIAEGDLTGEWLERLPLSKRAKGPAELAEILPQLERTMLVDVQTKRVARTDKRLRPRVILDLGDHGHALSVLPLLVYGDPPVARVDGDVLTLFGNVVPDRRPEEEHDLALRLKEQLNLVFGRRVNYDGADAIRMGGLVRKFQGAEASEQGSVALVPRVVVQGDTFDVSFEVEGAEPRGRAHSVDAQAVLRAYRDGLELVPIGGGAWAALPRDFLAKHASRIADLLAARDAEKRVRTAALPELGALCQALDMPPPPELARLAPLFAGGGAIPRATLPKDLNAELRDYQQTGIDWLCFLRDAGLGALLADDMGLGKTVQTIAALKGRILVVCPKSVVYNWADELTRFRPSLRVGIYHGQKRELDASFDVMLTTYAVVRLDIDELEKVPFDMVVLDEAQAIKNESSQTARAAFRLRGAFRVALSGTPVENRLEELWSLMHFANPGLLGGRADFQDRIAGPVAAGDQGAAERLRTKIRPFVMRRLKKDVLKELPPRTEVVLHVELDAEERSVYDAVRAATKRDVVERLAKEGGGGVLQALEALLRLRQASCHSALVPGQKADGSSKIERLMEALSEAAADGHKALVFSQWTSFLDLVEPHLTKAGIAFGRLDGQTRDRGEVVATFQSEGGPPVLLVSLKAGGTGLNLTAADHVFLLDPWWNPAVEDQAADRAHRIGQDRPVMVYRLVAKDTVEERMLSLMEKKRALAGAALSGAEARGVVTKDDLLALLD
ncbi:MAG: DEAD/DEAH box helicase [Myxococcales bacterium]|nr:DEAD/DEAH box helicase [Myxococcales bacterium]